MLKTNQGLKQMEVTQGPLNGKLIFPVHVNVRNDANFEGKRKTANVEVPYYVRQPQLGFPRCHFLSSVLDLPCGDQFDWQTTCLVNIIGQSTQEVGSPIPNKGTSVGCIPTFKWKPPICLTNGHVLIPRQPNREQANIEG